MAKLNASAEMVDKTTTSADISQLQTNENTLKLSKNQIKQLQLYKASLEQKTQETLAQKQKRILKEAANYEAELRSAALSVSKEELKDLADQYSEATDKSITANQLRLKAVTTELVNTAWKSVVSGISNVTEKVQSAMDTYIDKQQAIVAHLTGSSDSLSNVTDKMGSLIGTGLVKQTAVYENVSKLVTSGITSNVEQKAFLQTLADDIDATFNATDSTLIRLINLQQTDLTSNRLAIEYSLQQFLNQNYETSTYIKESFQSVSNSLIEMQSLMSAQAAVDTETVIQAYLGSLSSVGLSSSTITALADAINQVGSGDTSSLGSGVSNLVLMGAARSGLDYADLLVNGLNASTTTTLLQGIASYMAEMGSYSSNVVKSQLAKTFGVSVSDLVAAQNFNAKGIEEGTEITSNIYDALLNNFGELVPGVTKVRNLLENIVNGIAVNYASSTGSYMSYIASNMALDLAAAMTSGIETELKIPLIGSISTNWGELLSAAKILTVLPGLISSVGSAFSSGAGLLSGASSLYDAMANDFGQATIKGGGSGFAIATGESVSNATYINNNSDSSSILDSTKNTTISNLSNSSISQDEETYSATDIYKQLDAGQIKYAGLFMEKNLEYGSTVVTSSNSINDNVQAIGELGVSIYNLLDEKLTLISDTLSELATNVDSNNDSLTWALLNAASSASYSVDNFSM